MGAGPHIIMPGFMQRSCPSPFLVLFLTLAAGAARAQQASPCAPPGAPAPPAGAAPSAAAAPASPDSTPRNGGFDISSDRATVGTDGNAVLSGNVEVRQGTREIRAGQVEYDARTRSLKSGSAIEYSDPVVHLSGQGGSYSPESGAEFRSAQFELRQRAARGAARALELTPEGVLRLDGVTFTTCPANSSAWMLRARDITLDTQSRIGSGHGARVEFGGVPILWLPWVSFPLGSERKSGFLFPTLGNNSRSGAMLSVPWYWNIAPNADFTFQPVEYSRRGTDVGGDLRFLARQQRGELDWNYLPSDSLFHGSRSRVRLVDRIDFPQYLRLSLAAESVSDTQYFQDFAQGPEGTSTAFVERRATLSYRDAHWRVDAEAQHWQTVDSTLLGSDRPYARVPRIAAIGAFAAGPDQILRYGLDSELVNFQRSNRGLYGPAPGTYNCDRSDIANPLCTATGWRFDATPMASLAFDAPGFFAHPALAWRLTRYALDHIPAGFGRNPTRTLPIASFDTGLVLERPGGTGGDRTVTVEPRAMYLYVPYRNQDRLPVFDTAVPDLNPVELFRMNRYVGADRVGDADQVSVGVTSRLLDAGSGRQFMAATIGETFYFRTPRVTVPGEVLRTNRRSDFVGQLAVSAFESWAADLGLQWDPQANRSDRVYVNLQYRPSPAQVVNVGYRFQRDLLPLRANCIPGQEEEAAPVRSARCGSGVEQAEVSAAWPVSRSWNVFAREVYSLKDEKPLESFAGFEYRSCCWGVRFGGRRFVSTRSGNQDTGVFLELELIGLASVGSASNAVLMENIRGYVPADARMVP